MGHYQRIRDLREDADKTQTEIAEYIETTAQYYGKYESGEREIPFARAIQLSNYYNVSLDYLAGKTNIKEKAANIVLNSDELNMLELYKKLTERNKGKAELFLEQLLKMQSDSITNK